MKGQVINKCGDPSVFELSEIAKPSLKSGHVLIKVSATSVNQIDCKIRSGIVSAIAPDFPAILHGDVPGIVEEVADDVKNFKVGDDSNQFSLESVSDAHRFLESGKAQGKVVISVAK